MFAVRNTIDVKVLFIIHLKPFINLLKFRKYSNNVIKKG